VLRLRALRPLNARPACRDAGHAATFIYGCSWLLFGLFTSSAVCVRVRVRVRFAWVRVRRLRGGRPAAPQAV